MGRHRRKAFLALAAVLIVTAGCRLRSDEPTISFSLVPVADPGGPESLEAIRGVVQHARPDDHVILYSYSAGAWWVQPFASRPFTTLAGDLSWQSTIHLGERYAALLVDASYKPAAKLAAIPATGLGIRAVATTAGTRPTPITIHFSGYDWEVRQISSNWGGTLNPYDPRNAWVDQAGFLHLKIDRRDDRWFCADIGLTESLGQGSYSFTIRDVSGLDPAAVLRLYTWDHFKLFNSVLSVDLSRWGDEKSQNGRFVVHPSYEPHNIQGFEAPAGVVTFGFDWSADKVTFSALRGKPTNSPAVLATHTFTSGVPKPGGEKIHMSFYVYGNSRTPMRKASEVIVEGFRYIP
jgi:hypothetical protein